MTKISKEKLTELLSISGLPLENPEILQNNDIEMINYGEDIDNIPEKQTEYKDLWWVEETSVGSDIMQECGKWLKAECKCFQCFICSKCGKKSSQKITGWDSGKLEIVFSKFCPHCGTRMYSE